MRKLSPEKVRECREKAWLSQQDTADLAGVSLFTYQRIERGGGAVRPGTARAVARALGVTPDDLVDAPKVEPPRDGPAGPDAGGSSFGEPGVLAERRLLSSLDPFASQVEARRQYWWALTDSGQVDQRTLEYATRELEFTSRSFKALVDAAIAERWSAAELGLLRRVYEGIAGPYRQAWNALMEAGTKGFTSDMQGSRRLRLVADEAMRELAEAEETARTAA